MKHRNRKQFWLDHFKKFEQSGLSQIQYCKMNNINHKSFSAQKSLLRKNSKKSEHNFVPLIDKSSDTLFILKLSNGMEISFNQTPDPHWIGQMIKSLDIGHDQP